MFVLVINKYGETSLLKELKEDNIFINYLRMDLTCFDELLLIMRPILIKNYYDVTECCRKTHWQPERCYELMVYLLKPMGSVT